MKIAPDLFSLFCSKACQWSIMCSNYLSSSLLGKYCTSPLPSLLTDLLSTFSWLDQAAVDLSLDCISRNSNRFDASQLYFSRSRRSVMFNSRTAIAGAIISLLLVFFTIQRIWIVLGRCLFTTRRGVMDKSFFKSIFGVNFEAGNETREKIWSHFGAEQKWRAEQKESGFCSHRCFWESEKLMCEKIFSKRAKFFCSRAAFKSSFLQIWWLWGLIMILY